MPSPAAARRPTLSLPNAVAPKGVPAAVVRLKSPNVIAFKKPAVAASLGHCGAVQKPTRREVREANELMKADRLARAPAVDADAMFKLDTGDSIDTRALDEALVPALTDNELVRLRTHLNIVLAKIVGRHIRLTAAEKLTKEAGRYNRARQHINRRIRNIERVLVERGHVSFARD